MRTVYHEHLSELAEQLSRLCVLAGATMERATRALLQADLASAEQVISDYDKIVAMGTVADLRSSTDQNSTLEEIFLRLTGEKAARTTLEVLSV